MGIAGTATKIITKPGVISALGGGVVGAGITSFFGGLLGGGTDQDQENKQDAKGGGNTTTTTTITETYQNDYSTKNSFSYIVDSPFASIDTDQSSRMSARTTPSTSTTSDASAGTDAQQRSSGSSSDMLTILGVGALALGALYIFTGKK